MEDEDGYSVMISALEHYSYCPRQCALIHVEQTFDENIYTLRGRMAHERVDHNEIRYERDVSVVRGLPLWSKKYGLVGKADVVEFHGKQPYPVEYKLGKNREWEHEAVQVCAQALCLEEMFHVPVEKGAIYSCSSRQRKEIILNDALRKHVIDTTQAVRTMLQTAFLPQAVVDKRCRHCSLLDACLPAVVVKPQHLFNYYAELFKINDGNGEG